jgi:hypothetical protein
MRTAFNLDMTMMLAAHDAFRRDLELVATTAGRSEAWERFEKFLHVHHRAEDESLWPVLRAAVVAYPDAIALVDRMEAQHAAIDPLLAAIDASLDDAAAEPAHAELAVLLTEHLADEEANALPLIDRTLTEEQWMQFGEASVVLLGPDMPVFLPWLLDGADSERTTTVLARLPEPVQHLYRDEWQPAYTFGSQHR